MTGIEKLKLWVDQEIERLRKENRDVSAGRYQKIGNMQKSGVLCEVRDKVKELLLKQDIKSST